MELFRSKIQLNSIPQHGYPNHAVPWDVHWYYMIELGYCWSSFAFAYLDKRHKKDFWQMIVHHCTTLVLQYLSWMLNFMRVGAFVLLIHDVSDIFLQVYLTKGEFKTCQKAGRFLANDKNIAKRMPGVI